MNDKDGVAPRAKMNQQRSRRFKAALESKQEKELARSKLEEDLARGRISLAEYEQQKAADTMGWHFDRNCITPGTEFMDNVAKALRFYAYERTTTNPAWKNIQVIISDASVPGEGEHKIMDWIRKQKSQPNYDPNTKHVLCGLDADLIMLGLALHEPHFTILREFVAFGKPNPHERTSREAGQPEVHHPYQFLRLSILREYLEIDLRVNGLNFPWDLERAIDDYVFLCFFVGNDFLPHMPTLDIREGAIELLIETWKKMLPTLGGFITKDGELDLEKCELLLNEVGKMEDAILKRRALRNQQKQKEDWEREQEKMRGRERMNLDRNAGNIVDLEAVAAASRYNNSPSNNLSAASNLKDKLRGNNPDEPPRSRPIDETPIMTPAPTPPAVASTQPPNFDGYEESDVVRLGTDGWKRRYYETKFKIAEDDVEGRRKISQAYMEGLVWVLRYYYQGCASWTWYFPYHYAPFSTDLVDLPAMTFTMPLGDPFTPFEQLMSVLPAASRAALPEPYHYLMTSPESPIIDFYPETFEQDLNGKKQSWHAVVLLPFIDQSRLLAAVKPIHAQLSERERFRNTIGDEDYVVSMEHAVASLLIDVQKAGGATVQRLRDSIPSMIDLQKAILAYPPTPLDASKTQGVAGTVAYNISSPTPGTEVQSNVSNAIIENCRAVAVIYHNPVYAAGYQFPARLHFGVTLPDPELNNDDRRRPALFSPGAPASVILDAVLRSFSGRGGRGASGGPSRGGRGSPARGGFGGREAPYGRSDSGDFDRGDRGGRGGRGGRDFDDRGGPSNRGGRGGLSRSQSDGGRDYDRRDDRSSRGGRSNYDSRPSSTSYPTPPQPYPMQYPQAPPQYPGYAPPYQPPYYPPAQGGPPPSYPSPAQGYGQYQPSYPQQAQSASLSAQLAPMLGAAAQSLGVRHNYFQPSPQGSFQTTQVDMQAIYHAQQQARGGQQYQNQYR